ncbi:MAG: DUF5696 domain-containing protein [Oscillospiraceae bacterium]|jgi:hypothetical protein|nr:DUF5696 domain-containing protein [Oscillospiraceae bacterium]
MNPKTVKPDQIVFDSANCTCVARVGDKQWRADPSFRPTVQFADTAVYFDQAASITQSAYCTGVAQGFSVRYEGFPDSDMAFETICAIDSTTGRLLCTFVPLNMPPRAKVCWPAAFIADDPGSYGVFTNLQGYLLPTDWPEDAPKLPFGGQMACCTAYMPWFGMVSPDGAYLCVVREPWDTSYQIEHPAGGPTRVLTTMMPSLGVLSRQRTFEFAFLPAGGDYVALCKAYRAMAKEEGKLVTLRQKAARLPSVDALIGCSVMHTGVKSHVSPDSSYYNRDDPSKNDRLTAFAVHEAKLREIKSLGVDRLYLHLDGWGEPGYDNKHPDYLPACEAAGGWDGLRSLADTARELGYMFGIHDQYRDYYLDAPTYDPDNAVRLADGTLFEMSRWAGGRQNYLCSALAPAYVRRNFNELIEHGIKLDAAYLDVFTCNEPDECINPRHTVTRRESLALRGQCFDYLLDNGILPSSEEANDWAISNLVFCHWAPYAKGGIPVPLWNLVYHDCFLIPWSMGKGAWGTPPGQLGFLHALLNGGMGYLDTGLTGDELKQNVERCKLVSSLQTLVAHQEMISHEFVSKDRQVQRTAFADGTGVEVDFAKESYEVI